MTLAATVAEPLAPKQACQRLVEEPRAGRLRPDRHPRQPRRRAAALSHRAGRERRAGALGPPASRRWRPRPARTGRATGRGPSRLLAQPEPIETVALLPDHPPVSFTWRGVRRRVKRADGPERVFGEWWKRDAELVGRARLLPGRGRRRRALLALPRRRRRGRRDRLAALVPARDLRMSGSRYAELQVTSHFCFLRGASLVRGAVRAGGRCSASRRSASPTATRSPASSAPTRPPRPPACA